MLVLAVGDLVRLAVAGAGQPRPGGRAVTVRDLRGRAAAAVALRSVAVRRRLRRRRGGAAGGAGRARTLSAAGGAGGVVVPLRRRAGRLDAGGRRVAVRIRAAHGAGTRRARRRGGGLVWLTRWVCP